MSQIEQFSQEYIDKNTPEKEMLFKSFLDSQEPYTSIFKNNPWLAPPNFKEPLSRKKIHYWNTTVGRKHPYWKYAELVNGRLAMLGLVIGTVNYGLFGWIAPGLF